RIENQLCLLVRHVEVGFDSRDAGLVNLQLWDLDRSCQLGIIERAVSTGSSRQNSGYSQVSLLYGLELGQLNSGSIELNLIIFIFGVKDEIGFGRTRRSAHIKRRRQRIAAALELNRELLQPLSIHVALSHPHRAVSHRLQLRSMHGYIYRQIAR